MGYVEDALEARMKLCERRVLARYDDWAGENRDVFSILLEEIPRFDS